MTHFIFIQMGRKATRSSDDILQYGRDYYNKHKAERAHVYSLVSNRSRFRRQLKSLDDASSDKAKQIQAKIDAITQELDTIRNARWEAKREAGGARFKRFTSNDTINESTANIE